MAGSERILVVGVGGIGGTLAATLSRHQPEELSRLECFTTNEDVARSINERGYVVRGVDGDHAVHGRAHTHLPPGPFDWILLATQPTDVEEAARAAASELDQDGTMVCLQNGLCEERISSIVGPDRVVGAVVAWGASMPEPGVFDRTSSGGFTLGRLDGRDDPRLTRLTVLLEPVGPVELTHNLAGARWSKLAINCAISTLGTIGSERLGRLLRHRFVRRLALEIMTEAVQVARAEGVTMEKVSGTIDLDWVALTESERVGRGSPSLVAKHSLLLAVGARYRRLRSSMLAAIERGREPAVDFLNGEVVTRGRQQGIPTPANSAACRRVHAIARGNLPGGLTALADMSEELGLSV